MGWSWYNATHYDKHGKIDRRAECDAYFTEGFNEGWYKVEKSAMVGSVYYAAVRPLRSFVGDCNKSEPIPESEQHVFAAVLLTSTDVQSFYNFGYKDMDETMGPGPVDCPIGILNLLSPTDNEYANAWRECCRQRASEKKAMKKNQKDLDILPIGTVIKCGDTELVKSGPKAQLKKPFWLVVGKNTYYTKKYILKSGYEIISKPEKI